MDKQIQLCGHAVPRWQEPEGRKRLRQLQSKLREFKEELQDVHAAVLEHTEDLYLDRQRQLFQGSIAAIEHVEALLNFAEGGCIAVPDGWQKEPKC